MGPILITYQRSCRACLILCEGRFAARLLCSLLLFAFFGSLANTAPAFARDAPIEAFFGTYEGTASGTENGESEPRHIKVSIHPHGSGFNVTWSTTKAEGKSKTYSIDFEATKRPGIFGSAMRRNKFGDSVPLDPLKGDSYVWARITGQTLTVYGLLITEEGSYEMQVYHRSLSDEGLDLEFFRYLEGEPVRLISGKLVKVEE